METSQSIATLAASLALAQAKFEPIKRTEKVDYATTAGRKKYNYAPLEEVIAATRKALSENGLAVLQITNEIVESTFVLETLITHKSGEWIKGKMTVAAYPANPQQQGSALTYARRYALSAILGVASEEDDDAETVTEHDKEPPKQQTAIPPTEHWCKEHNTAFFMRGKMKSYAHPIGDTGEWCHEHKEGTKTEEVIPKPVEATATPVKVLSPTAGTTPVDLATVEFKNAGEFYTACVKYFKLSKSEADKEVGMYDLSNSGQRTKAWQTIVGIYGSKKV